MTIFIDGGGDGSRNEWDYFEKKYFFSNYKRKSHFHEMEECEKERI